MAEMPKTINHLNLCLMEEILLQKSATYDLINANVFLLPMAQTFHNGTETIRHRRQCTWHSLPLKINNSPPITIQSLTTVKNVYNAF